MWITSDFSFKEEESRVSPQRRLFRSIVNGATERALYDSAFENDEELSGFLEGLGLEAQVFYQLDLAGEIVSVTALHLPPQLLERLRPRLRLWVLRRRER